MTALAVIPARGGSKRIPRKNVRTIAGSPMLAHPLRAAAASRVFDEIHVSTDDPEIAAVAAAEGFPPRFARDPSLADDMTPIRDVVRAVMLAYAADDARFETVALIYATAVLIEPEDLATALAVFLKDPSRPLLSVVETGTPAEKMMRVEGGLLRPALPEAFGKRTQDLGPTYRDAGAFCFFSSATLEQEPDGARPLDFRPFVLDPWKGLDIDTESDWRFAEIVKAGLAATRETDP